MQPGVTDIPWRGVVVCVGLHLLGRVIYPQLLGGQLYYIYFQCHGNPRQHVALAEFKAHLHAIVRHIRGSSGPDARIILLTPPPVCHRQRLEFQRVRFPDSPSGQLERTNDNAEKYAKACVDVARESNVSVVNLWELMMEAAKASDVGQEESMQQDAEPWGRYLSDGLHLSHAGNTFVFSKLLETVERDWPELRITPCKSTGSTANSGSSCPALLPHLLWHDAIPN
eukprot:GEMP01033510.1.p1 GENE.GEMP01033510.1~~GEMP01033510.1.p1  ORF type:complete len:226 (+),score=32.86 GEMP01033510.1:707-1384(+)